MINEIVKKFKLTKQDIKRKNLASTITLIVEFFKVLIVLLFLGLINSNIAKSILIFSIVSTLISIFILFNNEYNKIYKYLILDLSSIMFFISNIIGGILIEKIIIEVDKKLIKTKTKKEKIKKLPIILYHNKIVYLYLFLSIIIGYQYLYINNVLFYILVFSSLVLFFKDDILISLKSFKKNMNKFLSYIFNNYFIMVIISNILFIVIELIVGSESTNQEILNQNILSTAILSILYAPIAEELLFRGCLRKLIKNDIAFILISGITFGAWHVLGYEQSLLQYLYIIPYSVIGIFLSYVYAKSNNLTTNVGIHALNNIVASLLPIIL